MSIGAAITEAEIKRLFRECGGVHIEVERGMDVAESMPGILTYIYTGVDTMVLTISDQTHHFVRVLPDSKWRVDPDKLGAFRQSVSA